MVVDGLRHAVKGTLVLSQLRQCWPELQRHLCDSPRRRARASIYSLEALDRLLKA